MDTRKILEQLLAASPSKTDVKAIQTNTSVEAEITRTVLDSSTGETSKETQTVTKSEKTIQNKIALKKPTCYVTVEFGGNVNLGNYNMGKVRVGISVPTGVAIDDDLKADIDSVYSFANDWVSDRVSKEIKKLQELNG